MFYLVYVSNATRALAMPELQDILKVSRENNARLDVTGLLLYKDASFMQLLEGEEEVVRELLDKITYDPRHYNVTTLQQGESAERHFSAWSMGFHSLAETTSEQVSGYRDFEEVELTSAEFQKEPSRSLKLLRLFQEHI